MIYTANINMALKLITEAHRNQEDKAGIAYILHPYEVANNVYNYLIKQSDNNDSFIGIPIEDFIVVALLHDVVEDTCVSFATLEQLGFNSNVITAVKHLTHNNNKSYNDYIEHIVENKIATLVKMFDLMHNMELSRFAGQHIDERILNKQSIYRNAYSKLCEKVGY